MRSTAPRRRRVLCAFRIPPGSGSSWAATVTGRPHWHFPSEPGSNLIVAANRSDPAGEDDATLDTLATRALGFVDEYCTTSYWAPMITLMDVVPVRGALPFRPCTGFDDLLAAVVEGRVDVAMVWDQVLARRPAEAVRTRAVAVVADLPAPLVYARGDLSATDARVLRRTFLNVQVDRAAPFFDEFAEPDDECVAQFARRMSAVRSHYKLGSRALPVLQQEPVTSV